MTALIIAAIVAALKDRLLAAAKDLEAKLPDLLKPAADQFIAMLVAVLDGLDIAALEQEALGRLVELAKTGKSESSHDPGVDFGA